MEAFLAHPRARGCRAVRRRPDRRSDPRQGEARRARRDRRLRSRSRTCQRVRVHAPHGHRKVILLGLLAPLVGIVMDFALKRGRTLTVVVALACGALAVWVFWSVLRQRPAGEALLVGGGMAVFVAWLVGSTWVCGPAGARGRGGADARPGHWRLGDPRGFGAARALRHRDRRGRRRVPSCADADRKEDRRGRDAHPVRVGRCGLVGAAALVLAPALVRVARPGRDPARSGRPPRTGCPFGPRRSSSRLTGLPWPSSLSC